MGLFGNKNETENKSKDPQQLYEESVHNIYQYINRMKDLPACGETAKKCEICGSKKLIRKCNTYYIPINRIINFICDEPYRTYVDQPILEVVCECGNHIGAEKPLNWNEDGVWGACKVAKP